MQEVDYFNIFLRIINRDVSCYSYITWEFLGQLPDEDKNKAKLALDEKGIFYVKDNAYRIFIRKEIKGQRYETFFKNYIGENKINLKVYILNKLIGLPKKEQLEYLTKNLDDIKSLVEIGRDKQLYDTTNVQKMRDECTVSALNEIGNYFLSRYKNELATDFYQSFYKAFNPHIVGDDITKTLNNKDEKTQGSQKGFVEDLRLKLNVNIQTRRALLNDLHSRLSERLECKVQDFHGIFSVGIVNEVPIWKGKKNELRYLINTLIRKNFIVRPDDEVKWKVVVNCFRLQNEELTIKMLRLTKDPKPKNRAYIEKATERIPDLR